MKAVAAAKFPINKPIEDAAQVMRVIVSMRKLAEEKGITNLDAIERLFYQNIFMTPSYSSESKENIQQVIILTHQSILIPHPTFYQKILNAIHFDEYLQFFVEKKNRKNHRLKPGNQTKQAIVNAIHVLCTQLEQEKTRLMISHAPIDASIEQFINECISGLQLADTTVLPPQPVQQYGRFFADPTALM